MTNRRSRPALLLRTVRHLKPSQVAHRLRLRMQRPLIGRFPIAASRVLTRRTGRLVGWPDISPIDALLAGGFPSASSNANGEFRFLEETRFLGRPPDWEQASAQQLWRYHLHYFEWAWAFAAHPDRQWARAAFTELWQSWREATPLGRGDGWHPYTASLRAWALCGLRRALVGDSELDATFVGDLAVHAGFLRANVEFDVGGNHLIKNLKALVGLGVFLGDVRLRTFATRHLARQLSVQVLSDGGHFERSPSYHCQVLGDLIDVRDLLRAAGAPRVDGLTPAIERMQTWLGLMSMPDGDVPLFNDCTLVGRARLALLGPAHGPDRRVTVLEPSGYVVIRPSKRIHLIADVGLPCPPELPAHAHADCLSFELAVDGRRVLVDSGTSTYQGDRRAYERSTAAHNTVEIDGANQTEVWGTFRAARLARPNLETVEERPDAVVLRASHDGYRRLSGQPSHVRTWHCTESAVGIVDEIRGSGRHLARAFLHVAPGIDAVRGGDGRLAIGPLAVTVGGVPCPAVSIVNAAVSPGFGRIDDARAVVTAVEAELPMHLEYDLAVLPLSTIAEGEPLEGGS